MPWTKFKNPGGSSITTSGARPRTERPSPPPLWGEASSVRVEEPRTAASGKGKASGARPGEAQPHSASVSSAA